MPHERRRYKAEPVSPEHALSSVGTAREVERANWNSGAQSTTRKAGANEAVLSRENRRCQITPSRQRLWPWPHGFREGWQRDVQAARRHARGSPQKGRLRGSKHIST